MTRIFAFFLRISPRFKRAVWKKLYQYLAKKYPTEEWTFMNYGYQPLNETAPLPLREDQHINRYMIQLYHHVAAATDLLGKDVLEVGSGRGGGSAYINEALGPKSMTGADYSKNAVNFSNEQHKAEGLIFKQGDAEKLPFENEAFDAIINVESSHCYGSMDKFVGQAYRVLRHGGHFQFADLRPSEKIEELDKSFTKAGFELVKKEDITKEVLNAMTLFNKEKMEFLQGMIKGWLKKPLNEFAGAQDSNIYKELSKGEMVYYHYVLQKPLSN